MGIAKKARFALVVALGIALSGLADHFLGAAYGEQVGQYVWAVGYATTIGVIWYVWLRPLDLQGPGG